VIAAVWTNGPVPWELRRALMCREFHCLPTELDDQPADDLMKTFSVLKLFDKWVHKKQEASRPTAGRRGKRR
jgi:hypothetical protein